MTLSSGDLSSNSEALSFAVIPVLVCRELDAHGCQSWESIMLDIGLGINLRKLSINGRCSEKKKKKRPVCRFVIMSLLHFVLLVRKTSLCEVFPHVAQLVEHLTCNAKVMGSIPGNMLLKCIFSKSPQTHISWLF